MPKDAQPRECSIADTLDLVGERWSLLAIRELSYGVGRFDQIVRNTGAPRDILTARLRNWSRTGSSSGNATANTRSATSTTSRPPPCNCATVLIALMKWGDRHLHTDDPPVRWRHSCGQTVDPLLICRHRGGEARVGAHCPTGRGALTT